MAGGESARGDHDHGQDHEQDQHSERERQEGQTPGAAGHPEPGSGHDDSETVTVDEGPPVEPVDGVPGAHGDVDIVIQQ